MVSTRFKYVSDFGLVSLLLAGLFVVPFSLIPRVFAPANVLSLKWSRSGLGSNWEGGLVIGDVTGDGVEDVVFAGGGNNTIYVLNGKDNSTIATYVNSRIGPYCQPQLYDVDGDGILDILVPLYYRPGAVALKYTGSSTLTQLWSVDTEGSTGSGSVMAKLVAGDVDHDGHLDIFVASQDVSPGDNSTGHLVPNGYDGTICRINYTGHIVASTFTWRPCSGGLSLADTDNDGVFELYQGDRNGLSGQGGSGYRDGGYGKGLRSLWADNLTERWNRFDFLSSSQSPVLVDVNGDGIKEVLSGMNGDMNILNSTNGALIKRIANSAMSVHYGFTVYDVDADGHLELLCSDGDHDSDPYADVFDLVTSSLDKELYLGSSYESKWSPIVANIYDDGNNANGSPRMEIIIGANTTSTTGANPASLLIFDNRYNLLQNVTGLTGQVGYSFVQDIDDDGLLELVTDSSVGNVYAYDTSIPAPGHNEQLLPGTKRIRSEVTYYGECRLGVAEHTILPWQEDYWTTPLVAPVSPYNNMLAISTSTNQVSFKIRDHQSYPITYTVTTSPNIGSKSGTISSGTYDWNTIAVSVSGLNYDTAYKWTVTANDGNGHVTMRTYTFRTELAPAVGNNPPGQADPTLTATDGIGSTTSTFNCTARSTTDPNGDQVTNIYNWTANGKPVANLLLPFDIRNATTAKDYSGYGNNGKVIGAAWVPNGKIGGAYSFDGQDDAIIINDGGAGYFDNQTHLTSPYHPELGGDGTWNEITVEAWIYLTAYNYGSRVVAKIPSYELGFASGYTNRLIASVWPVMNKIAPLSVDNGNQATTDQIQSVTYDVTNIQLRTWYHIAFTYKNGVGLKLYLNGALVAQSTNMNKGPIKNSSGEPLYIGRLVQPFAGMIDDVRIYSYAQSADQIQNRYTESKNGSSDSSLFIPIVFGAPGQTLTCNVIPMDSYAEGIIHSASVTLQNTPPAVSNLNVYPLRRSTQRLDDDDLGAGYAYSDPDQNPEGISQIRWYKNGVLQPTLNDSKQVPASNTLPGQTWYFTVAPKDSLGGLGQMQTSSCVTIRGEAAPTTNAPLLDSTGGTPHLDDDNLICTAVGTSDSDGDSTANIYHWIQDGASMANLELPFDTEIPTPLNSTRVASDYSGYGNNGLVNGSTWIQNGRVGGALSFDGSDFVRVQEKGNSLGGDGSWSAVTVEFWAKAGTTNQETVILKHNWHYSTGATSSYGVGYGVDYQGLSNGYQVWWNVYTSSGTLGANSITFKVQNGPNTWHHIVCTYISGAGLKIYTDGTLRASLPAIGNINVTSDGILDIGGLGSGSSDFIGQLDEVMIYPRALSAAQILQRYTETKNGFSASSTIVADETHAGDDWTCQVIPSDSWKDGAAKNSTTLNIASAVQYELLIGTSGSGTTSPAPGSHTYAYTASVSVYAMPAPGYVLSYWLLDDSNLGSTSPFLVTMDGDHNLTAVFVPSIFVDGFESRSFGAWSGTTVTAGETAIAVNTIAYTGTYSGRFTSNGNSTYERAYAYRSITSSAELYARGYFNVSQSGIADNGDRFYFMQFMSGTNILAYAGWRKYTNGVVYWHLMIRNGTNTVGAYSTSSPSLKTWYCVELHWKQDSVGGFGEMYVNGVLVCSVTHVNTANYGGAGTIRFGLPEIYNCSSTTAYADNCIISKTYIGPETSTNELTIHLVHVGVNGDMFWSGVNVSDSSFTGWTMLPGKTALSVASAVSDGKLCIVHVGVNNDMFWGFVNLTDSTFSGWTILPGKTSMSVTAAASDGALYIVHVGMNYQMFWGSVNLTDSSFSGWTMLPGITYLSPTAAASGKTLYLAHVGVTGDMFWGGVNLSDSSFTGWTMLPGKTSLGMALTVSEGKLYAVHVGVNDDMFWGNVTLSDSSFSGWSILPGKTSLRVGTVAFGGKLQTVHVGMTNDMFWGNVNLSNLLFSGWTILPGKTQLEVAVA